MSPRSRWGSRSLMVLSTTPAGTMSHTARGFVRRLASSASEAVPTAFSFTSSSTGFGDLLNTTHSWPPRTRRRTMFAPMRPRPIIPSCTREPSLEEQCSDRGRSMLNVDHSDRYVRWPMWLAQYVARCSYNDDQRLPARACPSPPLLWRYDVPVSQRRTTSFPLDADALDTADLGRFRPLSSARVHFSMIDSECLFLDDDVARLGFRLGHLLDD